MRVAVAGGTGVVGRHVVESVRTAGHEPVVLSRSRGVDLVSGRGLTAGLDGVDAIVDVANISTLARKPATRFFTTVSRRLQEAGAAAGVRHLVTLSIVGVDRVGLGYYQGKLAQEAVALSGPVAGTVLRATQFHEFAEQTLARVRGPVALTPRMRMRPVAASEVAARLVALVEGEPQGMADDFGGPEVHELVDLARRVSAARGLRRPVLPVRLPGATGRAMATGALLPRAGGPRGTVTFAEWLAGSSPLDARP